MERAVARRELRIEPFAPSLLKPASLVLRLGNRVGRWRNSAEGRPLWAPVDPEDLEVIDIGDRDFVIQPHEFVLGATLERVGLSSHLVGFVTGLSHVARFGLSVNLGSALISPNFGDATATELTLEIVNLSDGQLTIRAGIPICHLVLARMSGENDAASMLLSRSIYEGKQAPTRPMLYEEFSKIINS